MEVFKTIFYFLRLYSHYIPLPFPPPRGQPWESAHKQPATHPALEAVSEVFQTSKEITFRIYLKKTVSPPRPQNSFLFAAVLKVRQTGLPIPCIPHQNGTLVTVEKSTGKQHQHLTSAGHIRTGVSQCCTWSVWT